MPYMNPLICQQGPRQYLRSNRSLTNLPSRPLYILILHGVDHDNFTNINERGYFDDFTGFDSRVFGNIVYGITFDGGGCIGYAVGDFDRQVDADRIIVEVDD